MRLFGTDGVRGMAGRDLDAFVAMKLAMAAGIYFRQYAKTNKILVGKDTRRSGYMIENALVSGLTAVGYNVIQIGPMPTPAIAFLTENMRCDAGIMISASHNPYEDNGIKFFDSRGNKLNEKDEAAIEKIFFDTERMIHAQKTGKEIGSSKRIDDVIGRYIVQLKNSFPLDLTLNDIRVVLDTANGAAYRVAPTVFEELGADVIVINNKPNGYNINDNCGAMHPETLSEKVREYRADIGFAFDGDADRLVVVDEKGEQVDGDKLIGALALYMKKDGRLKNDCVVATVMSNQGFEDFLGRHGIRLVRSNVGDKYVLEEMQKNDCVLGGEQSGHVIFSEYAKTGDGLVTALQTIALVLRSGKKTSEVLNPFELYPQKLLNLRVAEKRPLESIEGLKEKEAAIKADGLRSLIRYSGTENKLRILLEGKSAKKIESWMEDLEKFFKKALNA
ncbi:phosphoglucosamine mutase [Hydrogenimonas urashimensis]|uniref:phosphoglucosamine mutase n=1 Tax=Hydrogenimonas urashimensis TaxID=2740515 RepID=UPI00191697D3|nr:phosphoglucosamine mutase [Hydrogenimonas urashimensis]